MKKLLSRENPHLQNVGGVVFCIIIYIKKIICFPYQICYNNVIKIILRKKAGDLIMEINYQKLAEKLMDENVNLKTQLSANKQKLEDLNSQLEELKSDTSVKEHSYQEQINKLQSQIANFNSEEEIQYLNDYIDSLKISIKDLEKIIERYRKKENFSDLERIHILELELEELRNRTEKNPFHAGRKRDKNLEEYIRGKLETGEKSKDIIGAKYIDKNGKTKIVSRATFYRIRKELNTKD